MGDFNNDFADLSGGFARRARESRTKTAWRARVQRPQILRFLQKNKIQAPAAGTLSRFVSLAVIQPAFTPSFLVPKKPKAAPVVVKPVSLKKMPRLGGVDKSRFYVATPAPVAVITTETPVVAIAEPAAPVSAPVSLRKPVSLKKKPRPVAVVAPAPEAAPVTAAAEPVTVAFAPVSLRKPVSLAKTPAIAEAVVAEPVAAPAPAAVTEASIATPAEAPVKARKTLKLNATFAMPAIKTEPITPEKPANEAAPAPVAVTEGEAKPRRTLSLKTKVDLPAVTPISRGSTSTDLAAAFKSEMILMTQQKEPEAAVQKPRASSFDLASAFKSEMILMTQMKEPEAAAPSRAPRRNAPSFDLASAFKSEMKAMLATQQVQNAPAAAPAKSFSAKARVLAA